MAKNFAITIGINHYEYIHRPLKYAASDAEKVRNFLLSEANFNEVFYYSDCSPSINNISTRPTRSNLLRLLILTFEKEFLNPGDNFWFFFSGHGARYKGIDYIIPCDAIIEKIEQTAISVDYIIQRLQRCGADNVILILDACRDDMTKSLIGIGEQTEKKAREKGIITIFSCSPNEYSWELEELQQGVFTYALLEGLGSKGKKATVEKLNNYLKSTVKELSQQKGKQTPRIMVDPIEKSHLILMPKHATKKDIDILKDNACRAEQRRDFSNAKCLWRRVIDASKDADEDARKALIRINIQERSKFPINKTRRQILILGGFVSSGFVGAVLTQKLKPRPSPTPLAQPRFPIQRFTTVIVNYRGEIINRTQGQAEVMTENIGNGVYLEMVKIIGGSFFMGSPKDEVGRRDNESPQHYVNIPEFLMGKYTVTQKQWEAIIGDNPSRFKGASRPVEKVSWNDATEFCQKLSQITGKKYSLPSESQWEYACRAGTTTPFYFGETITSDLVNYYGKSTYTDTPKGKYRGETTNVGIFPPNAFGLYDMHGNVWEWCADEWHDNYNGAPKDGSVWVDGNKERSPLRGGSWDYDPELCRSAFRYYDIRRDYLNYTSVGFRVVCNGGLTE